MKNTDELSRFECPSAQPDMAGARIFGMLTGSERAPRIAYLKGDVRVPVSALKQLGGLAPTQVFRFAAACEEHRCTHFDGTHCRLGERIVAMLDPIVDALPPCQIRPSCRWFAEQGGAVCLRCPQVVTSIPKADDALNRAAMPAPEGALGDERGR